MIVVDVAGQKCDCCSKEVPTDGPFTGPQMWYQHRWTCRHAVTWTCPECYGRDFINGIPVYGSCPTCGCVMEYT